MRMPDGRGRRSGQRCASRTSRPPITATGSRDGVRPLVGDPLDHARDIRRHQRACLDRRRLGHGAQARAGRHGVTGANGWAKRPAAVLEEGAGPRPGAQAIAQVLQPAQHAVEDAAEQPGAQVRAERPVAEPRSGPRPQAAGVLVGLHDGDLAAQRDDLARQPLLAQLDEVEEPRAGHPGDLDDRAADADDRGAGHVHSRRSPGPRSRTQPSASVTRV